MKICFIVFLFLIISSNLSAQQVVKGKVTNYKGEPIPNVLITVDSIAIQTTSSEDGNFSIQLPEGVDFLIFKISDYSAKRVKIDGEEIDVVFTDSDLLYDLSLEELLSIEVTTASRSVQKVTDAPATITIISKEMIRNRGYEDIGDVLKDLPGVDLQNLNGHYGKLFCQRGMFGDENKRTLLLVNGISDNQLWGNEVFTGQLLPLHNVERIEIIWGPASALYGANAFNGIINVITTPSAVEASTEVTFGGGAFETTFGRFKAFQPITSKASVSIAGSIYDSKGPKFKNRFDPDFSNAFIDKTTSLDIQARYKNTWVYFRNFHLAEGIGNYTAPPFQYLYYNKNISIPDSLAELGSGNTILSNINGEPGLRYVIDGRTLALRQNYQVTDNLKVKFQAYYRKIDLMPDHYDYIYKIRLRPNVLDLTLTDTSYFDKINSWHSSNNSGIELFATLAKKKTLSTVGIQYDYIHTQIDYNKRTYTFFNEVLEPYLDPVEAKRVTFRNIGISFQTIVPFKELLKVTLGVRYDANNHYGNQVNPRIGVISQVTKSITTKLLYGTAFRAPTARELYSTGIGHGGRKANPDLKPEYLQSFEGGLLFNINNFLFNELNLYYNIASDVIVASVPLPEGGTQNQNRSEMNVHGVEYKLILEPARALKFYGNISYQKGQQTVYSKKSEDIYEPIISDTSNFANYEIDIPNISNWKWNVGLNYHVFKYLNLNLMVNNVGKRSTTYTNPLRSVDGYTVANFTAVVFLSPKINFTLQVRNILDKQYVDPGSRTANYKRHSTTIEQQGRTVFAKLVIRM